MPSNNDEIRTFQLQVFRNGAWVDIPVMSAKGTAGNGKAGKLTVKINNNPTDTYRSRLYVGEKARAFRGILGQQMTRCWTGYVDAPTTTDQIDLSRSIDITDTLQELNAAITLEGLIYDNVAPDTACVDLLFRTILSGQYVPTNDLGLAYRA